MGYEIQYLHSRLRVVSNFGDSGKIDAAGGGGGGGRGRAPKTGLSR